MGLIGLITEKSLRTSPSASKSFSQGEVINRLSTDTQNIKELNWQTVRLMSIFVCMIIGFTGIINLVGLSILACVVPFLLIVTTNVCLVKMAARNEKKIMEADDKRIEVTTETIQNIKTIKLTGWEAHFERSANQARNK